MSNKQPFAFRVKERVKNILKSLQYSGWLYAILRKCWRQYNTTRAIKEMDSHGYEIMAMLHELFTRNNIPYYCDAGTLLGFIRDGGFIKGDADFDLSIVPNTVNLREVLNCLLSNGFRFMCAHEYNGRMIELTVMHPMLNLNIDVFLSEYDSDDKDFMTVRYLRWYNDVKYPTAKNNTVLEFRFHAPRGIKTINVHGISVSVPVNAEEILDDEYGVWRIYDPTFKSDNLPHKVGEYFSRRLTLDEALARAT